MSNVAKTYCNAEGEGCFDKYWVFCVIFGGAQLVLSQLPNMDSLWVVSAVGMFTSFAYSIIALALAINEGSSGESSIHGVPNTPAGKMWSVFNAMGAIVFAYSFSFILVEITDTMRSAGRGPVFHIKRAVNVSMVIITSFYIAVAVSGYVAFGNEVCGNIISCFTTPVWLIRATNIFVLIHMLPAYQVFSQPLFEFLQRQMASVKAFPPWVASVAFRIVFRSAYVAFVAFISVCLPFFSDIVGLIGAIGFWPATVFYPIEVGRVGCGGRLGKREFCCVRRHSRPSGRGRRDCPCSRAGKGTHASMGWRGTGPKGQGAFVKPLTNCLWGPPRALPSQPPPPGPLRRCTSGTASRGRRRATPWRHSTSSASWSPSVPSPAPSSSSSQTPQTTRSLAARVAVAAEGRSSAAGRHLPIAGRDLPLQRTLSTPPLDKPSGS